MGQSNQSVSPWGASVGLGRFVKLRWHRRRRAARTYPVIVAQVAGSGVVTVLNKDGSRKLLCDTCLGNCGLCGMSKIIGSIPPQIGMIPRGVTPVRS